MYTKEDIEKAKQYLDNEGYGTGSNFTFNAVANLMAEYAAKNCVIPAVSNRFILDACCGSRMFWFDKSNPNCLFIDKRCETVVAKDSSQKSGLRTIEVKPDLIADFTEMPFENETFAMVVFDPPHLKTLGQNSWMAKKYGRLPDDWQFMIQKGFKECMRVLKPQGTLIFKWNEHEINSKQVLDLYLINRFLDILRENRLKQFGWLL